MHHYLCVSGIDLRGLYRIDSPACECSAGLSVLWQRRESSDTHTLGKFKWEKLWIAYPLEGVRTPTEKEVKTAEELLGIVK